MKGAWVCMHEGFHKNSSKWQNAARQSMATNVKSNGSTNCYCIKWLSQLFCQSALLRHTKIYLDGLPKEAAGRLVCGYLVDVCDTFRRSVKNATILIDGQTHRATDAYTQSK